MKEEAAKEKKAEHDATKQKAENAAAKQNDDDAAKAKMEAEAKRQEEVPNHLSQPLYRLTQAAVQFMKAKPELGKVGKVINFPALFYESV